jgi:trans-2,3-dihydro-3-hydroxyanthranilate isomerase
MSCQFLFLWGKDMVNHPFYILDVFAEEKYAGNQLAVFRNAADIPGETMQKIANDMHFSETTFILSDQPRAGGYDVRIFTPEEEIPFAGHPTIGTAFAIIHEIIRAPAKSVTLNLGVGQIPVAVDADGVLWMTQKPPVLGSVFRPEEIAEAIGVSPSDIDDRFPVQEVSTGLPAAIVPLKSNGALARARRSQEALDRLKEKYGMITVLFFSAEPRDRSNDLSVRVFTVYPSVPEDPATGSACGCLAGYLSKHRYFGKDVVDVRAEQGYEMGRPSLLRLQAKPAEDEIEVRVGGRAVLVARGELV